MDLHVAMDGEGDLVTQVYRGLREAVRKGRLQPSDRLPATRELARRLALSRGTVAEAYERLVAEGFLTARVGAGTFVADWRSLSETHDASAGTRRRRQSGAVRPRPAWTAIPTPVATGNQARYDLRVGMPDAELFPFDTWRRLVATELRSGANSPGRYGDPAGHPKLRAAIARHVGVARSVRCDPDDVLVTGGTQQALDLISRVVLDPGAIVAVEEPGYPPAAALFEASGMRLAPVPVDDEGLVIDQLPAKTRLVYTTPSHQFPLGVAMSLSRRVALVEWAQEHDALIVEDDYDSEFRFTSRPLEPLVNLDSTGRVCYVGSFSKTMLPALRLGFVVAPPSLRSALRAARQLSDGFGPTATQAALARFLDEGMLARHVRKAATVYAGRHQAVLRAFATVPALRVVPSSAGLHVCARFATAVSGTGGRVVSAASRADIAVESLVDYFRDVEHVGSAEGPEGIVVGYGAVSSADLDEALPRLVRVLRFELSRS